LIATEKAYAKINLHLEVLNRRKDGYHNIFSVMAQVGLYDLLKLECTEENCRNAASFNCPVYCIGGNTSSIMDDLKEEDNLIVKAVRNLCLKQNCGFNGAFSLEKNIPAGAGLGGGSSDAATALLLVQSLCSVSDDDLHSAASMTGADVPFALYGGVALCEGIGEQVTSIRADLDYSVLLLNDGIHVDTGKAYAMLNRSEDLLSDQKQYAHSHEEIIKALKSGSLESVKHLLRNDFEEPVFSMYPRIGRIKDSVIACGADLAFMTGSGSTVVGLFRDKKTAQSAENFLKRQIKQVILTTFKQ
jgi:4-diphosphocytidyl-2-C-methyl-D-erythritol kinase